MKDLLSNYDEMALELIEKAGTSEDLDEKTAILMRIVAAKMQHQSDVPGEMAKAYNPLLTKAMRIGYQMAKTEAADFTPSPSGFFASSRVISAA